MGFNRVPGFKSFKSLLHHFVLAKLATSIIRVKLLWVNCMAGPLCDIHCLTIIFQEC